MKPASLKARITLLAITAVASIWLATAVFTWFEARHEIDEMLDGHLAQTASLLVVQAGHAINEIDTEHAPLLHKYARNVAFQIWEKGSILRLHSANAPALPLAGQQPGLSQQEVEGQRWRVFSTWDEDNKVLVHVGERLQARQKLANELAGGMLKPMGFALPALALLLWLAIARGMRSLVRVTAEVATRAPDNLSALATSDMPSEVLPLAQRLNALFARVAHSFEQERRFTADAAHELRTPLAGIRAQAQVALGANSAQEQRHALLSVIAGCDRATHLVEQLLTLARLDALPANAATPVLLQTLAGEVLVECANIAIGKNIECELLAAPAGDEALVNGHAALLRLMLRNLVDNALRYSPAGSQIVVAVQTRSDGVALSVSDNGPGITPEEREKVMQRFYRVLGSGEDGSGLGLSIVQRVAEVHRARVALEAGSSGHGLRVTVFFPNALP